MESYGTGTQVRLPGKSAMEPRIFKFGTPYAEMYASLAATPEDRAFFVHNGVLHLCKRGAAVKVSALLGEFRPERLKGKGTKASKIILQMTEPRALTSFLVRCILFRSKACAAEVAGHFHSSRAGARRGDRVRGEDIRRGDRGPADEGAHRGLQGDPCHMPRHEGAGSKLPGICT